MTALPVITLDGPAGVGKTTLAKGLAEELQLAYLDTGAMFRCLALKLGEGAHTLPEEEIRERCAAWHFSLVGSGKATQICCNGVAIGNEVRTEAVGMLASKLATVGVVRTLLAQAQRELAKQAGAADQTPIVPIVVEGRDMGTVVFPTAACKFFLDARPEVRAMRRLRELQERGQNADLATLTRQIEERDNQDRNRAIAPLRPAEDAILVDTSDLDIDGVMRQLLHHARACHFFGKR